MPRLVAHTATGHPLPSGSDRSDDVLDLLPVALCSMATAALDAETLLDALWESKGTDLLLTVGAVPMVRVDGDLEPIGGIGPLSVKDGDRIVDQLMTEEQVALFRAGTEVDFSFTWREQARLRGNAFLTFGLVG